MNINYFSITTPQGTGGIGIIELFGRDALEITGKIFRPAKHKGRIKPNRIYLGNIYSTPSPSPLPQGERVKGEIIDEVIIHFTPAKNSLTKLDTVEINAHGGIMPCRLIGYLLKRFGAKELSRPKLINLAHKQGRLDKIQAEALEYLLQAQTPLAAAVLLDQYNGALSKAIKSAKNHKELRESAGFGLALTQSRRILILGRPNVGKSTLFNALLGQDRAITHHLPGTTRDTIEDVFAIDGFPFVLVDTAGLRKSTRDAIEKIGIAYARAEIPKADVIVLVVEKDEIIPPPRHQDTKKKKPWFLNIFKLPNTIRAPIIVAINKIDLHPKIKNLTSKIPNVNISALKRTGIDQLRKEIIRALGLDGFRHKPGQPMVFTKRQVALIH
ncbi:MAG: GTP-binding protein [Planctomycetes bacterium]|nr:GTP-binding protein [Planctomycetota bacterium]